MRSSQKPQNDHKCQILESEEHQEWRDQFSIENSNSVPRKPRFDYSFEEISSNLESQASPFNRRRTYGSSDQSWSPGKDFENAPETFQSYKRNFSKHMNKSAGGSSCGSKRKGKKVPRSSERQGARPKCHRKGHGLNLDRIFEEEPNIKVAEEDDQVFIIDKDTYIKGIKDEPPLQSTQNQQKSDLLPASAVRAEVEDFKRHSENSSSDIIPSNVAQLLSKGRQIVSQKAIPLDNQNEMPDNYGATDIAAEPNPSHSLSSKLSAISGQLQVSQDDKRERHQHILNADVLRQAEKNDLPSDHNILGMLRLQETHEMANNLCEREILEGQQNPEASSAIKQILGKKRPLPIQLDLSVEDDKITKKRITSSDFALQKQQKISSRKMIPEINQNKVQISNTEKKNNKQAETILDKCQLSSKYLNNTGLKQRIQTQLKHLLQSSPIELQEDEQSNPPHPIQSLRIQSKFPKEEPHICQECVKVKQSQKSFINFLKQELFTVDEANANIHFDSIYCEQQTFFLVNGWSSHFEPDNFRKLVVIEKESYLQSIILKNELQREDYEKVIGNYKLQKVVMVGGDWFGIFRVQKIPLNRKQYCYVRMSHILEAYRERIVEYLTSME